MSARFYVEPNGAGGFEVRDRKRGDAVVTHSAFRDICERAVIRLTSAFDAWKSFYGVKS